MAWHYRSAKGTLVILRSPDGFELYFGSEHLGTFQSPYHAADDVNAHATGCSALNDPTLRLPRHLEEWRTGRP